ncbi:MAG: hypothetical protein AAFY76_10995 [Cyanobacteria bacterium J06649_11]
MTNLSPQWLKFIKSLGIEFWLPLPILGLSFWFVGGWLTEHALYRTSNNAALLKTTQPNYAKSIALIQVQINHQQGISLVTVKKRINRLTTTYTKSEIVLETTDAPSVFLTATF